MQKPIDPSIETLLSTLFNSTTPTGGYNFEVTTNRKRTAIAWRLIGHKTWSPVPYIKPPEWCCWIDEPQILFNSRDTPQKAWLDPIDRDEHFQKQRDAEGPPDSNYEHPLYYDGGKLSGPAPEALAIGGIA